MQTQAVQSFSSVSAMNLSQSAAASNISLSSNFEDCLKQAKSGTDTDIKTMSKSDVKESNTEVDTDVTAGKVSQTGDRIEVTKEPKDISKEVVSDEKVSKVTDAVDKVKDVIKEELGVTDEEIAEVLQSLQLNQLALLNTDDISLVVSKLSGCDGVVAIATDESLYESLTNIKDVIEDVVSELTDELNISTDEFLNALSKAETKIETKVETAETQAFAEPFTEVGDASAESVNVRGTDKENSDAIKLDTLSQEENISTLSDKPEKTLEAGTPGANLSEDEPETIDVKINIVKSDDGKGDVKSSLSEDSNSDFSEAKDESITESVEAKTSEPTVKTENNTLTFAERLLNETVNALNSEPEVTSYSTMDAYDIINQITEGIDVNIGSETSEVNLRLHPESLGNLSVKVYENHEGLLKATFTAENETVKAVLETQTIVLKEALENKGVKVEAVEVTVQSHAFERNLSDNGKSREESSGQPRKSIRRINLSEPEMSEEELAEDTLVREMMIQNGNTIDYSA